MKNWSYIILISFGFIGCRAETKDTLRVVGVDTTPEVNKVDCLSQVGIAEALDDRNQALQIDSTHDKRTMPHAPLPKVSRHDIGDKGFDERYRAALDSALKNPSARLRANDSILAVKRKEYAIKDSLRKLK